MAKHSDSTRTATARERSIIRRAERKHATHVRKVANANFKKVAR